VVLEFLFARLDCSSWAAGSGRSSLKHDVSKRKESMMRKWMLSLVLGAATALAGNPKAPDAGAKPAAGSSAKLDGAKLYVERTCVACHGKDAKSPILPEYPRLAGQSPVYAERQMHDIKSGARANGNTAAMKGVMHLVNDEEMKAIAEWIGTLK
jgi:cytochrome c